MKHNFPYLRDTAFLAKLDRIKVREEYVKIISLDFNENPLEEIQGKVISGSVNIAGGSALRRTCSFDMYVDEEYSDKILSTNTSFALNKKLKLYSKTALRIPISVGVFKIFCETAFL